MVLNPWIALPRISQFSFDIPTQTSHEAEIEFSIRCPSLWKEFGVHHTTVIKERGLLNLEFERFLSCYSGSCSISRRHNDVCWFVCMSYSYIHVWSFMLWCVSWRCVVKTAEHLNVGLKNSCCKHIKSQIALKSRVVTRYCGINLQKKNSVIFFMVCFKWYVIFYTECISCLNEIWYSCCTKVLNISVL